MKDWLENYLNSLDGERILARSKVEEEEFLNYPMILERYNAYDMKEEDVKVVLTCPYPDPTTPFSSNGLAWSSGDGKPTHRSRTLVKVIERDFDNKIKVDGNHDFTRYKNQGVFMPYQHITSRWKTGYPNKYVRWDKMMWSAISHLITRPEPKFFIIVYQDTNFSYTGSILRLNRRLYNHPILLGTREGVFNHRKNYFYNANQFLTHNNRQPIDWR